MRRYSLTVLVVALVGCSITELVFSAQDFSYTRGVAEAVVDQAGAATPREKVLALRDYLRREVHITTRPGWWENRSFFRQSAGQTLRSHEGWCGEGTRAFIIMAEAVGIPAERVNLYGSECAHVVAEADLGSEGKVIVDCQEPPHVPDLVTLDDVVPELGFTDYSTLNLRRVGLASFVPRLKLSMGEVGYWVERPHVLKAVLWAGLALGLVSVRVSRNLLCTLLHWRGWVHVSDRPRIQRLWQDRPADGGRERPEALARDDALPRRNGHVPSDSRPDLQLPSLGY